MTVRFGTRFGEGSLEDAARLIVTWLGESKSAVAFTGAGISTESGIPDFRSPGGVWAKNDPVYYDDFMRFPESRYEYWRQKAETHRDFASAEPNCTHQTLARWEAQGRLKGVDVQALPPQALVPPVHLEPKIKNITCKIAQRQERERERERELRKEFNTTNK